MRAWQVALQTLISVKSRKEGGREIKKEPVIRNSEISDISLTGKPYLNRSG